jgi:hypothetical protein
MFSYGYGYGYGCGPLPSYSPGQAPPAYSSPPACFAVGTPAPALQTQYQSQVLVQNGISPLISYDYTQIQHPPAQQAAYIQPQAQYAVLPQAAYTYSQAQFIPLSHLRASTGRPNPRTGHACASGCESGAGPGSEPLGLDAGSGGRI